MEYWLHDMNCLNPVSTTTHGLASVSNYGSHCWLYA